jgi:hypothetical protein
MLWPLVVSLAQGPNAFHLIFVTQSVDTSRIQMAHIIAVISVTSNRVSQDPWRQVLFEINRGRTAPSSNPSPVVG